MNLKTYTPTLPALPADRMDQRKAALLAAIEQHAGTQSRRGNRRPGRITPRRLTLPLRLALGGTGLASAATAVLIITGIGPSTAPAYASWTPTPDAAHPATLATLTAACQDRLASRSTATGTPQRVVVAERRGEPTAVVLDSPHHPSNYAPAFKPPTI